MESSSSKFINYFHEFYSHEFLTLSSEFKNNEIDKILLNNSEYITKEQVVAFDACNQCGRCCMNQRCPDWDPETKLCTRHDDPIDELCITYPWSGDMGIAPLLLNCHYSVSFFVDFFDNYFQDIVNKRGEEDASRSD